MSVKIIRPNRAITTRALSALENKIPGQLPSPYRAFLLQNNGGRPEENSFSMLQQGLGGVVTFFGILGKGKEGDLNTKRLSMADRVPIRYLPIADAEGGNLLVLSLAPPDLGAVYFWDHELEAEEGEPATKDNLYPIAQSFDEFLQKLRPFDPDSVQVDERDVKDVWVSPELLKQLEEESE